MAVADMPAKAYNPLLIYGGPGLGKTHLLHAIGNHLLSCDRRAGVYYFTAQEFLDDLVSSIRNGRMEEFYSRYRNLHLLLVDDIQFFANRVHTFREFFRIVNTLYESGCQIVMSTSFWPKELQGLVGRFRLFFERGVIADIQPPCLETRVAILNQKAAERNISLAKEVIHLIADRAGSNIRELEGCLLLIAAHSSLMGRPIDLPLAGEVVDKILPRMEHRITLESILRAVAQSFCITVSDLKSLKRGRSLLLPRQVAMYLARKYTNVSVREICHSFGRKDNRTIVRAYNKIENLLKTDRALERLVRDIVKGLEK
jgi:chromosomal replication initiator protein